MEKLLAQWGTLAQDKSPSNKIINWDKREGARGKRKGEAWIQDFLSPPCLSPSPPPPPRNPFPVLLKLSPQICHMNAYFGKLFTRFLVSLISGLDCISQCRLIMLWLEHKKKSCYPGFLVMLGFLFRWLVHVALSNTLLFTLSFQL